MDVHVPYMARLVVSPPFAGNALYHAHTPGQRSCVHRRLQIPRPAAEKHLGPLPPPAPLQRQAQPPTAHQGLLLTALLQDPVWGLRGRPPRLGL